MSLTRQPELGQQKLLKPSVCDTSNKESGTMNPELSAGEIAAQDLPNDNADQATSAPYLISQVEAARLLSISRTTIWRLVKQGDLAVVHIGSRTLISTKSIEEFVSDHLSKHPEIDQ